MRCHSCNTRSKGKRLSDFDSSGGRCPSCGHRFVADPPADRFTDVALARAVERVSERDTVAFLPEQLGYELLRRINRKRRRGKWLFRAGLALLPCSLVAFAAKSPVIGLALAALGAVLLIVALVQGRTSDVFGLARRFLAVNPSRRLVPDTLPAVGPQKTEVAAAMAAAKRIVVCQSRRLADFLLANQFALLHRAPVVGPQGALAERYPGLVERLARGPAPDVIVLHDFTPAGLDFARSLRARPLWLGRVEAEHIFDVGLVATHRKDIELVLRPLGELGGAAPQQGATFREGLGTELAAIRPSVLIAALGRSVEDHRPLRLHQKEDGDESQDDSE